MRTKNTTHLHHHPGPGSGGAGTSQPRSSVLHSADLPVVSGKVATSSAAGVWPFGPGLHSAPNKRVNLTRRSADVLISNRRTRKLRAVRWAYIDLEGDDGESLADAPRPRRRVPTAHGDRLRLVRGRRLVAREPLRRPGTVRRLHHSPGPAPQHPAHITFHVAAGRLRVVVNAERPLASEALEQVSALPTSHPLNAARVPLTAQSHSALGQTVYVLRTKQPLAGGWYRLELVGRGEIVQLSIEGH